MSTFRFYINKQSTLIKDNYTNNSQNVVWEIVRGKDFYSRHIFSIDLDKIRTKLITEFGCSSGVSLTSKVVFYNTIRYRDDLIGKTTIDGFYRDNNVTLNLFSFNEDFGNGVGYDYVYQTGFTTTVTGTPNWFYKNSTQTWNQNGVYSGNTAPNIIDTFQVLEGNENLEFDLTSTISPLIFNSTASSLNLGVSYSNIFENAVTESETFYKLSYFSHNTQTFFEPFIEITVSDSVIDNRNNFYLDQQNTLCLMANNNIDSVDKVEIYDFNGDLYTTLSGNSITKLNNKTYKINLTINSTQYPDLVNFEDKWFYTINGNNKNVTQEFTLKTNDIFDMDVIDYKDSLFNFNVVGISDNDKLSPNDKIRKISVISKTLSSFGIQENSNFDNLQYRLYVLQTSKHQIEVIPYTQINRVGNNNYFYLDIESLIPQKYYLEIRSVDSDGTVLPTNKTISFTVVE